MRVHLHPQRRTVEVIGRRSVGRLLAELGVLPSTAMVIRRDELLTDGEMVENDDEIEIRAVISGGADTQPRTTHARSAMGWEDARVSGRPDAHRSTAQARQMMARARGQSAGSRKGTRFQ
jgi:sulfur carrier protein